MRSRQKNEDQNGKETGLSPRRLQSSKSASEMSGRGGCRGRTFQTEGNEEHSGGGGRGSWGSNAGRVKEDLVQFSSVAQSCPTVCDPMDCSTQASQSTTNSRSLLKLMSIKSVIPSNHLILCPPLLLLPSVFSRIRVFSSESALRHQVGQSIGVSASISVLPMNTQV